MSDSVSSELPTNDEATSTLIFDFETPLDFGDPVQWLSGEWYRDGADYFFTDRANGYDAEIIDFDLNSGGFLYKSVAKIRQPSVGAAYDALYAVDDGFWYSAPNTPIDIPVVSLFQDIDYAHKIFSRHTTRKTNTNGEEIHEPQVIDITTYPSALVGDDLVGALLFFGVPTEQTINIQWVSKDGNDITGDGSKLNPYLTIATAITAAAVDDTIYIKTGTYTEGAVLSISKPVKLRGVSKTTISSTGPSYVVRMSFGDANATMEFEHLIFEGSLSNWNVFDNAAPVNLSVSFKYCYFQQYARAANRVTATSSTTLYENCIFTSTRLAAVAGRATINTDNKANNTVSSMTGCYIHDNSYDGIDINVLLFQYNKTYYSGSNLFRSAFYSTGIDVDYRYNEFYSTNSEGSINEKAAIYITGATSIEIGYNIMTIDNIGSYQTMNIFGEAATTTVSCHIHNNYITSLVHGTHVLSVGTEATGAGDNKIQNIVIEKNTILCHRYFDPSQKIITHALFVGFQKDPIIRYNYVNGGGINIIVKGSLGTANTTGYIMSNVSINAHNNDYMVKGISGMLLYNNVAWNDNPIVSATNQHLVYLLTNVGGDPPENTVLKNNIIMDVSAAIDTVLIFFVGYTGTELIFPDYNILYSANAFYGWRTDARDIDFLTWQGLGYDLNSIELTALQANNLFRNTDNEDYSLASGSVAIGAGEILAAIYDDALDADTYFGDINTLPNIITKQQADPWDIGAYVS